MPGSLLLAADNDEGLFAVHVEYSVAGGGGGGGSRPSV